MNHPPSDGTPAASPLIESPEDLPRSPNPPPVLLQPASGHATSSSDNTFLPKHKLQLSSLRSRRLHTRAENVAPVHDLSPPICNSAEQADESSCSPSAQRLGRCPRPSRSCNDLGSLREITNSGSRRRRRRRDHSHVESLNPGDPSKSQNGKTSSLRLRKSFENLKDDIRSHSLISSDSPCFRQESALPGAMREHRTSNTAVKRSASGESSRYVEHLESQLASLQTQLSAFATPSEIQSQAARLRALVSETRLLRQEVAEWEQHFNDRLQEQMDHHSFVLKNLREYISKLENELEFSRERLRCYEAEDEDKTNTLEALERVNQDLERRLECMSELLATSPGKLDFYAATQSFRSALKPLSRSSTISLGSHPMFSPQRKQHRPQDQRYSVVNPLSPTRLRLRHQPCQSTATDITMSSAEPDSDVSEQTLVNPTSPTRKRLSLMQVTQGEGEYRPKPARRMRRFHVGSAGPRSLILPAANAGAECPASAPLTTKMGPTTYEDETRASNNALKVDTEMVSKGFFRHAHSVTLPSYEPYLMSATSPQSKSAEAEDMQVVGLGRQRSSSCHSLPIRCKLWTKANQLDSENGKDKSNSSRSESPTSIISASSSQTLKHMGSPMPSTSRNTGGSCSFARLSAHEHSKGLSGIILTISRALDAYVVRARQTFHETWLNARLALRRPVIEFRMWLARIILGDMRRRKLVGPGSVLRMHSVRNGRHERTRSTGATIGLGIAPATASKGLLSSRTAPDFNLSTAKLGLVAGIVDHIGDDLSDEEDDLVIDSHLVADHVGADIVATSGEVPQAPAIVWLKFSMTMVVAVGLAIKDGPSSLFALKDEV